MPQKNIALLIVLFTVILSLSISGKLNIYSSNPSYAFKPKTTQSPKPTLLPLDAPASVIKEIKNFISLTPIPNHSSSPLPENESLESVEELKKSLGVSLDLSTNGIPFGGRVKNIQGCTQYCGINYCGPAYELITVGPPVGGNFTLTDSTTIYREYNESVGNWVLGLSDFGFEACSECVFDPIMQEFVCLPIGFGAPVKIMGTSK